jgi:hypothetical protein
MTSAFDVLSEVPIETSEFGEGENNFKCFLGVLDDKSMIQTLLLMLAGVPKRRSFTDP